MTGPATDPIGDRSGDLADTELWAGLRDRAADRNRERVAVLRGLADAWSAAGAIDDEGSSRARRLIHELVGSAGTFGYPTVSEVAEGLTTMVAPDGAGDLGRLHSTLDHLSLLLDRPPADEPLD